MIEEMKVLEDQIHRLMEMLSHLKEDRSRLEARVQEGEKELQTLRQEVVSLQTVEKDCRRLQQEQSEVRTRIEKMLGDLKGVDGGKGSGEK